LYCSFRYILQLQLYCGGVRYCYVSTKRVRAFVFRPQMTEIAFVLKAVATLVSTLKKTPPANGELKQLAVPVVLDCHYRVRCSFVRYFIICRFL